MSFLDASVFLSIFLREKSPLPVSGVLTHWEIPGQFLGLLLQWSRNQNSDFLDKFIILSFIHNILKENRNI